MQLNKLLSVIILLVLIGNLTAVIHKEVNVSCITKDGHQYFQGRPLNTYFIGCFDVNVDEYRSVYNNLHYNPHTDKFKMYNSNKENDWSIKIACLNFGCAVQTNDPNLMRHFLRDVTGQNETGEISLGDGLIVPGLDREFTIQESSMKIGGGGGGMILMPITITRVKEILTNEMMINAFCKQETR